MFDKKKTMKTGIIGAGIAGLATAVRLAIRGESVTVFEKNNHTGGKLSAFQLEDYRFDRGPSLFTMPQYIDELFQLAGKNPKDYFQYQRLPNICNYFWEDGTRLQASANKEEFAKEVEQILGVPAKKVLRSLEDSASKYDLTGRIFLEKSLHRWKTWWDKKVIKALMKIPQFDLFTTMNRVNQRMVNDPKMTQLLNRYATYNGSNPYKAPGLLTIIPHLEYEIGAFYPQGGMISITQAVTQLAKDLGVTFKMNSNVEKILLEGNVISGLQVNGENYAFDQVISNMDVFFTYEKLLPKKWHPKVFLNQEKSTSALIFYWGIRHQFEELDLHNIFFSEDYEQEFALLQGGKVSDDPTVYINISSKYSPEDAPTGSENWFTMINVPYNQGQNWDEIIERSRQNILAKVGKILNIDLSTLIAAEEVLQPLTIESLTGSHLGALYGTSSNNKLAAFLRHPNFSSKIKNLYFCGGSAHPGGGIPLCLQSAKIVEDLIYNA